MPLKRLALMIAFVLGCPAASLRAAEPQVAFVVTDDWVELRLTQDDNPVPDAYVQVFDSRGSKFADGQTGPKGTGEFPLPSGTQFRVEIKIGDRRADMILLTQVDGIVVPTNVLLSFGLAPCCRYPARGAALATEPESSPPVPETEDSFGGIPGWMQGGVGTALTVFGIAILVRHERRVPAGLANFKSALMSNPIRPRGRTAATSQWMIIQAATCVLVGGVLAFGADSRHRRPEPEAVPDPDLGRQALEHLEQRKYRPLSDSLEALVSDKGYNPIPTQVHPLLGQSAPDFTLPDTDGTIRTLADEWKQKPVVLVFYYGYACDHCVSQLFALNTDLEKFRELGASVWAVSADPPELTRKRFKQYGAFGYPVLSDPDHAVATKYSTYLPNPKPGEDGDMMHGTFLIDRSGRIRWANRGDQPFTENRTLLVELHKAAPR